MINLLPLDLRDEYRYARRNSKLLHWLLAPIIALIVLIGIGFYGNSTLSKTAENYQTQIKLSQASLKEAHIDQVKAEVGDISRSLDLTLKVLSREVLFSKLLTQITVVIPKGVNLTGLNINQDDGAIDLSAHATDYHAATQFQANLVDPANQIFSSADLENAKCNYGKKQADPNYPCQVSIRAEFAADSQFLFIHDKSGGKS